MLPQTKQMIIQRKNRTSTRYRTIISFVLILIIILDFFFTLYIRTLLAPLCGNHWLNTWLYFVFMGFGMIFGVPIRLVVGRIVEKFEKSKVLDETKSRSLK